jgi:hypothetical protein
MPRRTMVAGAKPVELDVEIETGGDADELRSRATTPRTLACRTPPASARMHTGPAHSARFQRWGKTSSEATQTLNASRSTVCDDCV